MAGPTSRPEEYPGRDSRTQDETAVGVTMEWDAGQFATVETFDDSRPTDSWALAWSEYEGEEEDEPYRADPIPSSGRHVLLLGVAAVVAAVGVGGLALTVSDTDSAPSTSTTRVIVPAQSSPAVGSAAVQPFSPAPTNAPVALATSRPVAAARSAAPVALEPAAATPVPMETAAPPIVTTAVVTTTVTAAVGAPPGAIVDPLPPKISPPVATDWLPDAPVIPFPQHPVIDPAPANAAPPVWVPVPPEFAMPLNPIVAPVVPIVVAQPVSGINQAGQGG